MNQSYADDCLKRTMDKEASVQWLQTKDELTRGKMVEYLRRGWPQGEALEQALADTLVQWSMAPVIPAGGSRLSLPEGFDDEGATPPKKARHAAGKIAAKAADAVTSMHQGVLDQAYL